MFVSQLIFDVPRDVEAERLMVDEIYTLADPPKEVGVVDLARSDPQGPEPQEVLAIQLEYENMRAWEPSYDLYDQGSKDTVPLEQHEAGLRRYPVSTTKYSFPRLDVRGDRATLETVLAFEYADGTEDQLRTTFEAVLEDEGWQIVMRPEQYEFFLGGEETTQ